MEGNVLQGPEIVVTLHLAQGCPLRRTMPGVAVQLVELGEIQHPNRNVIHVNKKM